jgi:transcriptional regulator with XRE-family HTH domain
MTEVPISPAQVRAARALLAWSQQDLARQARVGTSTVADFERGHRTPVANNSEAMRVALENAGISFLPGGAVVGPPPPPIPRAPWDGRAPVRWVNATDLSQWADRRDGQGSMPELLTRLIRAAAGSTAQLQFPSDESVQLSGWDGICNVDNGTEHIPCGSSGWEIGTQRRDIKDKADGDYTKRTAKPLGLDRRKTTFVFVTPRHWTKKSEWARARLAEKKWADVRAYDADDLVHWIELYPAVGHWLAVRMGKRPAGVQQLDEAWEEWSLSTQWPLSADLILAGRDEDATRVLRWLREEPSVLPVQGESADEAVAFLHAAIQQLPNEYRMQYCARCLIAGGDDVARALGDSLSPLIVVLEDAEPGLAQRLAERGHHVYVARGPDVGSGLDNVLQLSRPPRDAIEHALVNMGIEEVRARNLAQESARSLAVLRRLIPSAPGRIPEWAKGSPPRGLIAALLAGAWDEEIEGDKAALERLSGEKYEVIAGELAHLVGVLDNPLRKAGAVWKVASPRDAWFRIGHHISSMDFARFEAVAHAVFSSRDPRYEMDSRDRWLASVRGVRPEYSEYLRRGLGEILILFSLFGKQAPSVANPAVRIETIVQKLLQNADQGRWWSLSRDFQLLAEAAPDAFLTAVDEELDQHAAVTVLLSEDKGGPAGIGGEYVSNLLWALQSLAWGPQYIGRVSIILAKLATRDPGGRYGNRPNNSLRQIFLLWLPQTFTPLDGRLRVLDQLRKIEPDAAWELMLDILPSGYDSSTNSPQTRWRDLSVDPREDVTYPLIAKGGDQLAQRLLADVGLNTRRWNQLIKVFPNLGPDRRAEAAQLLLNAGTRINDDEARVEISKALRRLLHRHRELPEAEWTMPADELDAAEEVYAVLQPADRIKRSAWLFTSYEELPRPAVKMREGKPVDKAWDADQEEAAAQRRIVVANVLSNGGIDAIFALAETVELPHLVGIALAQLQPEPAGQDAILKSALSGPSVAHERVGLGMVETMFRRLGEAWATGLLSRASSDHWGAEAIVRILTALPETKWTWRQAAAAGKEVEDTYWSRRSVFFINSSIADLVFAVEKLIEAHRATHAIRLVGHSLRENLPAELLVRVLTEAVKEPEAHSATDLNNMLQYYVVEIFKYLDKSGVISDAEMARLEWSYLPLFQFSNRPPRALQNALSTSPQFFVEVLCALYRPTKESGLEEPPPTDPERATAIAGHAHNLFRTWRQLPGTTDDNSIDGAALESWMKEARKLSAEVGRAQVGDLQIGQMLAAAPRASDGIWPMVPVRDVIEITRSRELERGILTGIHNSLGPTWRGMTDGGAQERELAQYYGKCSQETSLEWPRTSAMLEQIAKSYEHQAGWHDDDAERRDW